MKSTINIFVATLLSLPLLALGADVDAGVSFKCTKKELKTIQADMDQYLASLKIDPAWFVKSVKKHTLSYRLNTSAKDSDTLHLVDQKKYQIEDEEVSIPVSLTEEKKVKTVSRKEIVLALFHSGRLTQFTGKFCSAQSFIDHVGVRQNTVLWAQNLDWYFPEGVVAFWNEKYWNKGTPVQGASLTEAYLDMFLNPRKYGIGCFTAAKIVMTQGVLDYYHRVAKNPQALKNIEAKLMTDKDPLVNVEPPAMWSISEELTAEERKMPGKIVVAHDKVAPMNFIPGDWVYLMNTDAVSAEIQGYEGSNGIYLGRTRFSDYYNTHHHAYTYKENLDKVYQWRHGVFNRPSDTPKAKTISEEAFKRLGQPPEKGGLVMDTRAYQEFFTEKESTVRANKMKSSDGIKTLLGAGKGSDEQL